MPHSRHPEAAAWKVELPAAYRWGLGPVRYRRSAHEEAQIQKTVGVGGWVDGLTIDYINSHETRYQLISE